jgi:hypothetical protein
MADADPEEQPVDPVDVPLAFLDQRLAFPANPAAILIIDCRHTNHRTDARLTALHAISVRTSVSPSIRSVFARRCRRDTAIDVASTTRLAIQTLPQARDESRNNRVPFSDCSRRRPPSIIGR